jgi:thioesterase domain-containing protein/ketosteroid isomerase-like protein
MGGGAIHNRTPEESRHILRAKVDGTLALDAALAGVRHDFLFLCSSLTALAGVYGQADYAAANAFLDAFAVKTDSPNRRVVSVNWDGWSEVGGYARSTNAPPHTGLLTPSEGARLFELCLAGDEPNYAVSKTPLSGRTPPPPARTAAAAERSIHGRPEGLAARYAPPQTDAEERIAAVWRSHFALESIGVNDDFFDLGGDSLLAVQVAHGVREALGADVPAHVILENPTIAQLASQLNRGPELLISRQLVRLAAGPQGSNAHPIFLVHPIGGHVYFYLPLAAQLSTFAPVYGIQAPGVDGEASPLETIEEMAQCYINAMRTVQPAGPYRLAGSSFGGVVCFEMAQQLAAAGQSVELLAMIDSPSPWSLDGTVLSDAEILAYMLARGTNPESHLRALERIGGDEMLRYFLTHGGANERLAPNATLDSVRHFLHLFRANFEALTRYRPVACSTPGVFFRAIEHFGYDTSAYAESWRPYFARFDSITVPGNHTSMNLAPRCNAIASRIAAELHPRKERIEMSHRIELAKDMFEQFLKGNTAPIFEAVADDVEVRLTIGPGTPLSGVFRGPQGLGEYFARNAAAVEQTAFEIHSFLEGEGQVAITGRESLTVRATGVEVKDSDWVMVCTFNPAGKIGKIVVIEDTSAIAGAYRPIAVAESA